MANIDRNFVLDLLAEHANIQQNRATTFADAVPARSVVSGDRAYSLSLLIGAVEDGLLERLAEEQAAPVAEDASACCVAAETFEHDENCALRVAESEADR